MWPGRAGGRAASPRPAAHPHPSAGRPRALWQPVPATINWNILKNPSQIRVAGADYQNPSPAPPTPPHARVGAPSALGACPAPSRMAAPAERTRPAPRRIVRKAFQVHTLEARAGPNRGAGRAFAPFRPRHGAGSLARLEVTSRPSRAIAPPPSRAIQAPPGPRPGFYSLCLFYPPSHGSTRKSSDSDFHSTPGPGPAGRPRARPAPPPAGPGPPRAGGPAPGSMRSESRLKRTGSQQDLPSSFSLLSLSLSLPFSEPRRQGSLSFSEPRVTARCGQRAGWPRPAHPRPGPGLVPGMVEAAATSGTEFE